jgi:hypothetical protein
MQDVTGGAALAFACASKQQLITLGAGINCFCWSHCAAQLSDASIIMDASEYIEELKQKVVRLKQEMACEEEAAGALLKHSSSPSPTV